MLSENISTNKIDKEKFWRELVNSEIEEPSEVYLFLLHTNYKNCSLHWKPNVKINKQCN